MDGTVDGPKRDVVLLNAGAALMAAGKASSLKDGIDMARESIGSGAALKKVDELVAYSRSAA